MTNEELMIRGAISTLSEDRQQLIKEYEQKFKDLINEAGEDSKLGFTLAAIPTMLEMANGT